MSRPPCPAVILLPPTTGGQTCRSPRSAGGALAIGGGVTSAVLLLVQPSFVLGTVALMPGVSVDLASIEYLASTLIVVAIVGAGLHMLLRPARLAEATTKV